jgi:hypothetical protein
MTLIELLNCLDQFIAAIAPNSVLTFDGYVTLEGGMSNVAPAAMTQLVEFDGHELLINNGGIKYTISPEVKH